MTHVLIVQGHPDPSPDRLCQALALSYRDAAEKAGHTVQQISIAHLDIPILRSRLEWEADVIPQVAQEGQQAVMAADHIVLIYPLWMGDVPALLKAWIEQVFRSGFAFNMHTSGWHPALKGKSARVVVTMGMPGLAYRWFFFAHSLRSLERNILKFCGIRPVRRTIIGNAEDGSGKVQRRAIETMAALGAAAR